MRTPHVPKIPFSSTSPSSSSVLRVIRSSGFKHNRNRRYGFNAFVSAVDTFIRHVDDDVDDALLFMELDMPRCDQNMRSLPFHKRGEGHLSLLMWFLVFPKDQNKQTLKATDFFLLVVVVYIRMGCCVIELFGFVRKKNIRPLTKNPYPSN